MRVLQNVAPTSEQLKILSQVRTGVEVIRGSAGSGKTTTAILRLRFLTGFFLNRRKQTGSTEPVRTLVLSYNRTLRGYINALVEQQATQQESLIVEVETFAHWAMKSHDHLPLVSDQVRRAEIKRLGAGILDGKFLCEEVDYILSRYLPTQRNKYLTANRDGRGSVPRVDASMRQKILKDVIVPYIAWKNRQNVADWTDLETAMALLVPSTRYDIVIADEVQDFSANQIRSIQNHVRNEHAITFVLDGAQRIYARGFTWSELGLAVSSANSFRLQVNYRNTREIAAFAVPLITGITAGDDDATMPDFTKSTRSGPPPVILRGKFSGQIRYAVQYIRKKVNLSVESVAFLHGLGGGWFRTVREGLDGAKLPFVEITRQSVWPLGPENIALSTIHSAKGLEFDHVFILGLDGTINDDETEDEDDGWRQTRRLLAMGIGRAKQTVHLGYKKDPNDPPWVDLLDPNTYTAIDV